MRHENRHSLLGLSISLEAAAPGPRQSARPPPILCARPPRRNLPQKRSDAGGRAHSTFELSQNRTNHPTRDQDSPKWRDARRGVEVIVQHGAVATPAPPTPLEAPGRRVRGQPSLRDSSIGVATADFGRARPQRVAVVCGVTRRCDDVTFVRHGIGTRSVSDWNRKEEGKNGARVYESTMNVRFSSAEVIPH